MSAVLEDVGARGSVHVTLDRPGVGRILDEINHNLRTTAGFQAFADQLSGGAVLGDKGTATAVGANSLTDSGKSWTANEWAGRRAIASNGTILVYANITSNTGTVATHDGWKDFASGAAATAPTGTPLYAISLRSPAAYIAVSTDSGAPAIGDTTLASEVSTNGLSRALGTVSYNAGTKVLTISVTFTATGTVSNCQKTGLFDALTNGTLVHENTFTAATVVPGDVLTVSWAIQLS